MYVLADQEKRFESYRKAEGSAMASIVDGERQYLFDYLIRMTGLHNRAADTTEEILSQIETNEERHWDSLIELRIYIYKLARTNCADIWNAETEFLINPDLDKELELDTTTSSDADRIRKHQLLDKFISALSPHRREAILLNCRQSFSVEETAEIMEVEPALVATEVASGLEGLQAEENGLSGTDPRTTIKALQAHGLPVEHTLFITDLQEIMGEIDKGIPGRRIRLLKLMLLAAAISFATYLYLYHPQWVADTTADFWKW